MHVLTLFAVLFTVLFWVSPETDIMLSKLFYDYEKGFYLAEHPIPVFIYESVKIFVYIICLLLLLNVIIRFIKSRSNLFCRIKRTLTYRQTIYLLLVLALGPGLLVHQGFKENLPRPRPKHIVEFGGNQQYARPFEIREGIDGKSFVSGHAATVFFIASFAFLFKPGPTRFIVYKGGIVLGIIAGLARIAQGKHFLSDIIFSGIFILLLAHLLYYLILYSKEEKFSKL